MTDYSMKAPGVYVEQMPSASAPLSGAGTSTAAFIGVMPNTITISGASFTPTAADQVVLVTNFTEFATAFGSFSDDHGQKMLAHAVRGFFNNGGTRCYVTRVLPSATPNTEPSLDAALQLFESIDEIAIVAAPGLSSPASYTSLATHVTTNTHDRFAILDTPEVVETTGKMDPTLLTTTPPNNQTSLLPSYSDSFALYFPWLQVVDPATSTTVNVPPSGHMAGIYARVDGQRGVFKAPANEVVLGATGLKYAVSPRQQDALNPQGVNCIRRLNGNILVWGARTLGGENNADFKYINVRRTFNYIRASIDRGTQWAVFEPNNAALWAKITREASAFLRTIWASGGLFGDKPEQAFYVKCDAETNPTSVRDAGMVVTEIGVAITRPAEFVVFKLGQLAGQAS
jgi:hypothetical protein